MTIGVERVVTLHLLLRVQITEYNYLAGCKSTWPVGTHGSCVLFSQTFRIVLMAKRMNYGRTSRASVIVKPPPTDSSLLPPTYYLLPTTYNYLPIIFN